MNGRIGDPTEVHFVSALTGYGLAAPAPGEDHSVYQTVDGGMRWSPLRSPVTPLAVAANSASALWVADADSLWRTNDGGHTWSRSLAAAPRPVGTFASSRYGLVHMQAAGSNGVWIEFDEGQGAASQRP